MYTIRKSCGKAEDGFSILELPKAAVAGDIWYYF